MTSVAAFKWLDGTKYRIVKDEEQDPTQSRVAAKYVAVSWRQGSPQAIDAHATARFVVFGEPHTHWADLPLMLLFFWAYRLPPVCFPVRDVFFKPGLGAWLR